MGVWEWNADPSLFVANRRVYTLQYVFSSGFGLSILLRVRPLEICSVNFVFI